MRTFRDHMESALYDDARGFYATRTKSGDFYTAPELHPAFGEILADKLATLLGRLGPLPSGVRPTIIEAGCGDGTLACQVARRLHEKHPRLADELRFVLVDRTRRDLTVAARRLSAFGLEVDACTDIRRQPSWSGVLYSNELMDALPAHLLEKRNGAVFEVYVDESQRETLGPVSTAALSGGAAAVAHALGEGERHGICLEALEWLRQVARRLDEGFLITVDYGKRLTPGSPNPPRAFRRHCALSDLSSDPGTKDLTLPVDFEAMIREGARVGLALESYQSLSELMIEGGVESWLAAAAGDTASAYRERAQMKTLLHPEGMGEAFKILIQRKCR